MEELEAGTAAYLKGETPAHSVFAHPLPFNLIPHIDKFQVGSITIYVLCVLCVRYVLLKTPSTWIAFSFQVPKATTLL